MNLYDKYILPKYLGLTMRDKALEKHRADVAGGARGTVLEIGFGSGLNLPYYLSANVSKLYALEPSRELYDLAKARVEKAAFQVEYMQASAEHIPLPNNSIDSAVSTWTLCSIPHPEIALKEVLRVLKPGGIFYFAEHGKSPRPFIFNIQNFLTPLSRKVAGGCHMNRDIERLIIGAGFQLQKIEKLSQRSKPLGFMYKGTAIAIK